MQKHDVLKYLALIFFRDTDVSPTKTPISPFTEDQTFSDNSIIMPVKRDETFEALNIDNESSSEILSPEEGISNSETHSMDIENQLRFWAVKHKITHVALNDLLKILQNTYPYLPGDSRTLLKTIRHNATIQNLSQDGELIYIGIANSLKRYDLSSICFNQTLNLRINIDGLPLCKSSSKQFWPILGLVVSNIQQNPFVIACYYGESKPSSVEEYLSGFITEANDLKLNGFEQKGIVYKFNIVHFNCDAPARSFLKCIKNHNSYYGCEKCIQKGTVVEGHVKFLSIGSPNRDDNSFRNQDHPEHHNGISPLLQLDLGLVSQFPLDPMHLIDLGIVRKLIMYWIKNGIRSKHNSVRLGSQQKQKFSENLAAFAKCIPSDFSRKPRSLKEVERWKATEFRQFLLYIGPVVLKDILPHKLYTHFLCLHVAVSILSNPFLCDDDGYIEFSELLIKSFVEDMISYYGKKSLVYNVHNILHIPNDVRLYGCIENFTCYPFENFLGKIKVMLRSNYRHLGQLAKRLSEQCLCENNVTNMYTKWVSPVGSYNTTLCIGDEFAHVIYKTCRISSTDVCDKYIQLNNNKIMAVQHVIKNKHSECVLICDEVICGSVFYSKPCSSNLTKMYKVVQLANVLTTVSLLMIKCKCIVNWEYKVVISLIHKI